MSLRVVGDQAYTPEEWAARERRRAYDRARFRRRYDADPEFRERWRDYQREYQRRRKHPDGYRVVRVIGSLHEARCTGPTKATGCRCKKVYAVEPS